MVRRLPNGQRSGSHFFLRVRHLLSGRHGDPGRRQHFRRPPRSIQGHSERDPIGHRHHLVVLHSVRPRGRVQLAQRCHRNSGRLRQRLRRSVYDLLQLDRPKVPMGSAQFVPSDDADLRLRPAKLRRMLCRNAQLRPGMFRLGAQGVSGAVPRSAPPPPSRHGQRLRKESGAVEGLRLDVPHRPRLRPHRSVHIFGPNFPNVSFKN